MWKFHTVKRDRGKTKEIFYLIWLVIISFLEITKHGLREIKNSRKKNINQKKT